MPKLRTEKCLVNWPYQHGHRQELALKFTYEIYVTQDGLFTTTLPEEAAKSLQDMGVDLKTNSRRGSKPGYFAAHTVEDLVKKVQAVADEAVTRELVKEEIVLKYAIDTRCSYVLDKQGRPAPNGYWAGNKNGESSEWREGTHKSHSHQNAPTWGLSVYVAAFVKKTYRYKSGNEKIEEETWSDDENRFSAPKAKDPRYWLCRLEAYTSMGDLDAGEIKEVPYTEAVAAFFVRLMENLAMMNEMIKGKLEPESIMALAKGGGNLLGPATKDSSEDY